MSLIHLDECCDKYHCPETGYTYLYDVKQLKAKAKGTKKSSVMESLKRNLRKKDSFNPFLFLKIHKIPVDKICGVYPMVFENYRFTIHCVRMAWAFFLTLNMSKMGDFSFPQRSSQQNHKNSKIFSKNFMFKNSSSEKISQLFIHFYSQFRLKGIKTEVDLIKCLKNSLCRHVSLSLDQSELPDGDYIDLVPIHFRQKLSELTKDEEINFFFSLLQSKALCAEVPEDFILDTLIKHQKSLTRQRSPLDPEVLETLRQRGREFGRLVKRFYKPNRGFLPTNKATFAFTHQTGGVKGDLVNSERLINKPIQDSIRNDRMEPFVIGLFGQPGMGKSSRLPEIISVLSTLFPGVKRDQLCYSRSCNTEHWDGYRNQPIVILDDLGQSLEGKDIKEFQTLVSSNPYIPPMADLKEKGILFTSPIIIMTSNLNYGDPLSPIYEDSCGILDDASFWRRIHVPIYVEDKKYYRLKEEPCWVREHNLLMRKGCARLESQIKTLSSRTYYQRKAVFTEKIGSQYHQGLWTIIEDDFFPNLLKSYRERVKFHENIKKTWTQEIGCSTDNPVSLIGEDYFKNQIEPFLPESLGFDSTTELLFNQYHLEFDAFPPAGPLPVRVEPIREPLKVRTITAGIGDTFCLKPFQRAMWLALGEEEQFCLTHGTNNLESAISKIYSQSDKDDVWISGDYSAATDSFPIEATKALLDGILEHIDHEPTKRWALKEISPHLLVYPEKSGLKPSLQTSGQLMGSLLSFPLLCLLNDCTAKSLGLKTNQYLINGDDILMRTKAENYDLWKGFVQKFGLELSLGKNYIHPEFGTVNSQLIKNDRILTSGKQKVLDRRARVLGECLRDLEMNMELSNRLAPDEVKKLFKKINRCKLSQTVRSIDVPYSHGGLALNWGPEERLEDSTNKSTQILVYLHDLLEKITPQEGCLSVPYLSTQCVEQESVSRMDQLFNEPVSVIEHHEDFVTMSKLSKTKLRIMNNQTLRTMLGLNLRDLPSLSFLKTLQVPFKDEKIRKELQDEIHRVFLSNFLDSSAEYSYSHYKQSFLEATRGISSNCKVTTKYLVSVLDLNVKPDYLLKVAKGFSVSSFDKGKFEESLGCQLKPKLFDLPEHIEAEDFSKEVISSYDEILKFFGYGNETETYDNLTEEELWNLVCSEGDTPSTTNVIED